MSPKVVKAEPEETNELPSSDLDESDALVTPLAQPRFTSLLFSMRSELLKNAQTINSISGDLKDVSQRLLEPDTGLFARVKSIEDKVVIVAKDHDATQKALKKLDAAVLWKSVSIKLLWLILGVLVKYIFDHYVTKAM